MSWLFEPPPPINPEREAEIWRRIEAFLEKWLHRLLWLVPLFVLIQLGTGIADYGVGNFLHLWSRDGEPWLTLSSLWFMGAIVPLPNPRFNVLFALLGIAFGIAWQWSTITTALALLGFILSLT